MRDFPRIAIYDGNLTRLITEVDFIEFMTFPGGEPHVKLTPQAHDAIWAEPALTIDCRPRNFTDIGYLMLLVDNIRRISLVQPRIDLLMPYFPGARQDRGEPYTVRIMVDLITGLNFGQIDVYDPHSQVLVNELKHRMLKVGLYGPPLPKWPTQKYVAVIVPDAGAVQRSQHMADQLGYDVELIHCTKKRDPVTGALSGFELKTTDLPEGTYLLFDDICDGGGTFNGVAAIVDEAYREQYGRAADIDLFVTHGIFSKGTDELFEHFTTIYSTTSWRSYDELMELDVIPVPLHPLENRA